MTNNYYQKNKENLQKGTKIFWKKKKAKSVNMLVSDIEIFLKKKKKRSINMFMNDIRMFLRTSIKSFFPE